VRSALELLTVGRVSVDLYAEQTGVGFAGVRSFAKSIGGTATNVAVAAARLGRRAAVLTAVGDDEFGGYVRQALEGFAVDTRFVATHPTLRTPLAFAAMDPPEDPRLLFYREPEAPDMLIRPEDVDMAVVRDAPILWISASALSREPSRGTVAAMLAERARRPHTVLDLDWRPLFWASEDEGRRVIGAALDSVTVAVGNRAECEIAVGTQHPDEAAAALLARGMDLAVVKLGGDGVLVATREVRARVPRQDVAVVCGLGAGDAFGGALCHGLLSGWPPERMGEFANAAGAIVASRLLCADAMPTEAEILELMAVEAR
jgi:5-dehydro-2-deoxygluconokinase